MSIHKYLSDWLLIFTSELWAFKCYWSLCMLSGSSVPNKYVYKAPFCTELNGTNIKGMLPIILLKIIKDQSLGMTSYIYSRMSLTKGWARALLQAFSGGSEEGVTASVPLLCARVSRPPNSYGDGSMWSHVYNTVFLTWLPFFIVCQWGHF